MNVGDYVIDVRSVGVIVGVSTVGNPIVEWKFGDTTEFNEYAAEELVIVEMPKPAEELNPEYEKEED